MTPQQPAQPRERGVVIVWFALFLLLLLTFIAVGVDLAKLMAARTQLQNAADAAALAGASAVDPATANLVQATAIARAQQTALLNKAFIDAPQPVVVDAADVTFPAANRVRVTTRREDANSIVTYFARVLGINSLDMTATATAEADTASTTQCIVPLGVQPPPTGSFVPGCGNVYSLKLAPGAGTSGNYGYLGLGNCAGVPCTDPPNNPHQISCLIENGWCCDMSIGENVNTAPGTKTPAIDGVNALFKDDTDKREGICYSDYTGNGKRVILVPIVTGDLTGLSPVQVVGFGAFFMQSKPAKDNGDLSAEFVYISAAGSGGGSPSGGVIVLVPSLVE